MNLSELQDQERYQSMSIPELERQAQQLLHQENEVMKELLRRGWGRNLPNELEHPDMKPTEDDL
jgi:hypothetical protein